MWAHSLLGAGALNWRLTRSSGFGADLSENVVRIGLPRMMPCRLIDLISLATQQRATSKPSRFDCHQTEHALTFQTDHPMGAGQDRPSRIAINLRHYAYRP